MVVVVRGILVEGGGGFEWTDGAEGIEGRGQSRVVGEEGGLGGSGCCCGKGEADAWAVHVYGVDLLPVIQLGDGELNSAKEMIFGREEYWRVEEDQLQESCENKVGNKERRETALLLSRNYENRRRYLRSVTPERRAARLDSSPYICSAHIPRHRMVWERDDRFIVMGGVSLSG